MPKKNKIIYAIDVMRPRDPFEDIKFSDSFYVDLIAGDRLVQLIGQYEIVSIRVYEPDRGVPDGK